MARPREFDDATTRGELMDEFWDRGYHATSTDDLCRRSGLSRSSLYNAYGKKRDCYLASLDTYASDNESRREEVLSQDLDGREALRIFMTTTLDGQWADEQRRVCLMINASVEVGPTDEAVLDALRGNAANFRNCLHQLVLRGQRDGSITSTQPADVLAFTLHASLDGLQVQGRLARERAPIDAAVDTLLALI